MKKGFMALAAIVVFLGLLTVIPSAADELLSWNGSSVEAFFSKWDGCETTFIYTGAAEWPRTRTQMAGAETWIYYDQINYCDWTEEWAYGVTQISPLATNVTVDFTGKLTGGILKQVYIPAEGWGCSWEEGCKEIEKSFVVDLRWSKAGFAFPGLYQYSNGNVAVNNSGTFQECYVSGTVKEGPGGSSPTSQNYASGCSYGFVTQGASGFNIDD